MPKEHGLVTFPSPEQAARHHATIISAISRGGWIFAADGARLARGWTAYAAVLQQAGVILQDGEGYRLAQVPADASTPSAVAVAVDASAAISSTAPCVEVPADASAAPIAAAAPARDEARHAAAPALSEAGHATARALLADPAPLAEVPAPARAGTLIAGVLGDTLLPAPTAAAPPDDSDSARRTLSARTATAPRCGRRRTDPVTDSRPGRDRATGAATRPQPAGPLGGLAGAVRTLSAPS